MLAMPMVASGHAGTKRVLMSPFALDVVVTTQHVSEEGSA